jgi:hypothetical protein
VSVKRGGMPAARIRSSASSRLKMSGIVVMIDRP